MPVEPIEEVVARAVAEAGDGRILLLGPVPVDDGAPWLRRCRRATARDLLDPPGPGDSRYDLAVIVGVLECLPPGDGVRLLGSLRDLRARRLLVAVPADSERWRLDDMLALGLEAAGDATGADTALALYGFDIDRYKRTPDWLNARNWANPDLWGRYRW